jgi:hypothetical protein
MQFWHDLVTKKSFDLLKELQKKFDFVLIGGWAVFLHTKNLKSKDLDLVCDYDVLAEFREKFEVFKNDRLKKYEAKINEIDVDIYVPFYSNPGIPTEEIKNYTTSLEGFKIPKIEVLLILKQKAYQSRKASPKGQKDKVDMIALLQLENFDFSFYKKILRKYKREDFKKDLIDILNTTYEVKELNLNRQKLAKFKKKVLGKLK